MLGWSSYLAIGAFRMWSLWKSEDMGSLKPMLSAISIKYFLKIFATLIESVTISSLSQSMIFPLLWFLLVKNGLIVGQKLWFFGPPSHRYLKYLRCDDNLNLTHLFLNILYFSWFSAVGNLLLIFRALLRSCYNFLSWEFINGTPLWRIVRRLVGAWLSMILYKCWIKALVHTLTSFKPYGTAFDSTYRSDMNGSSWKFFKVNKWWVVLHCLYSSHELAKPMKIVVNKIDIWPTRYYVSTPVKFPSATVIHCMIHYHITIKLREQASHRVEGWKWCL